MGEFLKEWNEKMKDKKQAYMFGGGIFLILGTFSFILAFPFYNSYNFYSFCFIAASCGGISLFFINKSIKLSGSKLYNPLKRMWE